VVRRAVAAAPPSAPLLPSSAPAAASLSAADPDWHRLTATIELRGELVTTLALDAAATGDQIETIALRIAHPAGSAAGAIVEDSSRLGRDQPV